MKTAFQEFAEVYQAFKEKYPQHPMIDEVRSRIVGGRMPTDQWLRTTTTRMRNLMAPFWLKKKESGGEEAA
ncbi:MAG: hypothetical protein ACP5U1_13725 [Desulfomonilaceae bacterium]